MSMFTGFWLFANGHRSIASIALPLILSLIWMGVAEHIADKLKRVAWNRTEQLSTRNCHGRRDRHGSRGGLGSKRRVECPPSYGAPYRPQTRRGPRPPTATATATAKTFPPSCRSVGCARASGSVRKGPLPAASGLPALGALTPAETALCSPSLVVVSPILVIQIKLVEHHRFTHRLAGASCRCSYQREISLGLDTFPTSLHESTVLWTVDQYDATKTTDRMPPGTLTLTLSLAVICRY